MIEPPRRTVTPWLAVEDARAAHDFYTRAFDATSLACEASNGRIVLGLLRFGDSLVAVVEPMESMGLRAPKDGGRCSIALEVPDADAMFARAVSLGAHAIAPVRVSFAGERHGLVVCPFGHRWILSTRTEDLAFEQVLERFRAFGRGALDG
jgi:PhnB protein